MKKLFSKRNVIIFGIIAATIIIIIILFYFYIINPPDHMGRRCKTGYNQNFYIEDGINIEIPIDSCFVSKCCETAVIFRSKKNYNDLRLELEELRKKINKKYPERNFSVSVEEQGGYRSYTFYYN